MPNNTLPTVGGRTLTRSHLDFEHACLVLLGEEQEKPNPNNALVAVLCDAVRLSREHCDQFPNKKGPFEL